MLKKVFFFNLFINLFIFIFFVPSQSTCLKGHRMSQRESILLDLESFEAWLQQAYDTVLREPSRHLYPPSLVDEELMRAQSLSSIYTEGEGTPRTDSAQNEAVSAATGDTGTHAHFIPGPILIMTASLGIRVENIQ